MKILYAVQGTGNGHITRARLMAKALHQRTDIQVDYLFSGRPVQAYFDMSVFKQYSTRKGLSFHVHNGRIQILESFRELDFTCAWRDIRTLPITDYDLVINDFEPIAAWAAKLAKVPCIDISHQAALRCQSPVSSDNFFERLLTKYYAPSSVQLGIHWFHFDQLMIPPFIDQSLLHAEQTNSNKTLVYLPFESLSAINDALFPLSERKFEVFHPHIQHDRSSHNIQWRRPKRSEFLAAMKSANAVIANAGFELATECLSLGKPLMVKPLQGQFEQLSNAKLLEAIDAACVFQDLNSEAIEDGLLELKQCRIQFPTDPKGLIDWIISGSWHNPKVLCDELWHQVEYPAHVKARLYAYS